MKATRTRYLREIGWLGLATGVTVVILGGVSGGEFGALAQAYGVLGSLAAIYMIGGLWLLEAVRRRRARPMATPERASGVQAEGSRA